MNMPSYRYQDTHSPSSIIISILKPGCCPFPIQWGTGQCQTPVLNVYLPCGSTPDRPHSLTSFSTHSNTLLGLPRPLMPGILRFVTADRGRGTLCMVRSSELAVAKDCRNILNAKKWILSLLCLGLWCHKSSGLCCGHSGGAATGQRHSVPTFHCHGPLTRYVKSRVAHAPGMPGTFSPPPTSKKTAS